MTHYMPLPETEALAGQTTEAINLVKKRFFKRERRVRIRPSKTYTVQFFQKFKFRIVRIFFCLTRYPLVEIAKSDA